MTIVLELEPEQVSRLETRSQAVGQSVKDYLLGLAFPDSPVPVQNEAPRKPQSYEEWLTLLHQAPEIASDYPPPTDESLRREAMYEDRI